MRIAQINFTIIILKNEKKQKGRFTHWRTSLRNDFVLYTTRAHKLNGLTGTVTYLLWTVKRFNGFHSQIIYKDLTDIHHKCVKSNTHNSVQSRLGKCFLLNFAN